MYRLLMLVDAGGTRTCVHPHVSRPYRRRQWWVWNQTQYLGTWNTFFYHSKTVIVLVKMFSPIRIDYYVYSFETL